MTRGSPPSGAIMAAIGRNAGDRNAREAPNRTAIAKMGPADVGSVSAYSINRIELMNSPNCARSETFLRLSLSATVPVTSTNNTAGMNSASPSQPISNSESVMSKMCLPRAAACNITPVVRTKLEMRRGRIPGADNATRAGITPG